MSFVFPFGAPVPLPVIGRDEKFTPRLVYYVDRNYAAHPREMGFDPRHASLFFFCKPAGEVTLDGYGPTSTAATVPIPL